MDGIFDGMNISRSKVEVVSDINFQKFTCSTGEIFKGDCSSRKTNPPVIFLLPISFG